MERAYKTVKAADKLYTWSIILLIWVLALLIAGPRIVGIKPYVVMSGSMEPTISTGAMVYVKEFEDKPQIGDVTAFYTKDQTAVIHRIVDVDTATGAYITKGDANSTIDAGEITDSDIIGKYQKHIPRLGYLIAGLESHILQIGPVKLPALVLILLGIKLFLDGIKVLLKKEAEEPDTNWEI